MVNIQAIINCTLLVAILGWLANLAYKLFSLRYKHLHECKLEELRQIHELKLIDKKMEDDTKKMTHEIEMKKLNMA